MINRLPSRRGAALLLILVMLSLVVSACAALARLSIESHLTRSLAFKHDLCRDLLGVCDAAIIEWLQNDSGVIVLPPDITEPRVEVLMDTIETDMDSFGVQITAWDQTGMVPLSHIMRGSLLRTSVPRTVLRAIDRAQLNGIQPFKETPGLDLIEVDDLFPSSPWSSTSDPVSSGSTPSASSTGSVRVRPARSSLGAFVATHNPYVPANLKRRRHSKPCEINVNTAPMPLIETAMRMAGRRGVDQIEAARRLGEPAQIGNESSGEPIADAPRLVTTSSAWAFRIDVSAGTAHRSWWSVFIRDRGSWTCVQRLDILQ